MLFAQAASQSELELCASLESAELKLACFEALTARYSGTSPKAANDNAEPPAIAEPMSEPEPEPVAALPAPEPAAVPAAEASLRPSSPMPDEQADDGGFKAVVVKVTSNRVLRRLTFEMENGEIWRQVESDRLYYPKDGPFEVQVRRGIMGDYQLRVGGEGRMTRIKRIR